MPGKFDKGAPREMHDAVCNECNTACRVPFKPTEGKPIYCKDCYTAKRPKSF
jgi:CxxC-x17-CxxC domain-containing protein